MKPATQPPHSRHSFRSSSAVSNPAPQAMALVDPLHASLDRPRDHPREKKKKKSTLVTCAFVTLTGPRALLSSYHSYYPRTILVPSPCRFISRAVSGPAAPAAAGILEPQPGGGVLPGDELCGWDAAPSDGRQRGVSNEQTPQPPTSPLPLLPRPSHSPA